MSTQPEIRVGDVVTAPPMFGRRRHTFIVDNVLAKEGLVTGMVLYLFQPGDFKGTTVARIDRCVPADGDFTAWTRSS